MNLSKLIFSGIFGAALGIQPVEAGGTGKLPVIEVATFKLQSGVTPEVFAPIDHLVEIEHVSKQPGFLSRESAAGANGEWLVIVHWRSLRDADASMATFENAPVAAGFMAKIDASTMSMKRYQK